LFLSQYMLLMIDWSLFQINEELKVDTFSII
jgi:hypothetical protein